MLGTDGDMNFEFPGSGDLSAALAKEPDSFGEYELASIWYSKDQCFNFELKNGLVTKFGEFDKAKKILFSEPDRKISRVNLIYDEAHLVGLVFFDQNRKCISRVG